MSLNVAELNKDNEVINVILVNENYDLNTNEIFYTDDNPAYIGGDYVEGYFYPKQPFASWTRSQGHWVAPKPKPTQGKFHEWNEELGDWVETLVI
jgi:hypothetical protein